jgi:hypothetical protein
MIHDAQAMSRLSLSLCADRGRWRLEDEHGFLTDQPIDEDESLLEAG